MSNEHHQLHEEAEASGKPIAVAESVVAHFPRWFIAMFALIYVTGYLIDFFYYASLGITDPGSEPLKLHYIQIGLVFLLGHLIVVALLVFTVFGAGRLYKIIWAESRRVSNILTSIMSIAFTLSIYIAAIFTPPQYFQMNSKHFFEVLELIGFVTLTYLSVMALDILYHGIERWIKKGKNASRKKEALSINHLSFEIVRSLILAVIVIGTAWFDCIIFRDLFDDLKEMFMNTGWVYLAFVMIFSLFLFRIIKRLEEVPEGFGRVGIASLGFEVLLMIYFLSVVIYAYTIFPYIANVKGGADYTASPRAHLTLRPHVGEHNLGRFASDVIIIYTTSAAIYLADYKGPNDPCKWRSLSVKPVIREVMRSEIQSIEVSAAPVTSLHPNCNVP